MNIKSKFSYILLILVTCFSFVNNVFADGLEFSVSATADKTEVAKGNVVTIMVSLKSDEYINSCTFEQVADSTLELLPTGDDVDNEEKGVLGVGTFGAMGTTTINVMDSAVSGKAPVDGMNILRLKYRVNGSGKVTIKTVECVTISEKNGTYDELTVNINAIDLSEDTTLKSLSVTGGTLSNFSSTSYTYSVPLESSNFSLKMEATNPDYQDDIVVTDSSGATLDPTNITYKTSSDQNLMLVFITVNNGTKYELALKYENKDLDNSLSSLTVAGQKVELESGKYEYTVKVGKDVSNVKIEATLADSTNFQFADGNDPGTYSVSGSSTTIALIVEPKSSESGSQSVTYMIDIVKEGSSGGNASSNKPSSNSGGNAVSNPQTGNISMFIMAIILVASLLGSVVLYQKNIEGYNNNK